VYTFYAAFYLIFDEVHHPFLLLIMVATTLVVCLGAWGYFRSALPLHRVGFLVGGLALSIGLNFITAGVLWLDLPVMVMMAVMVGLGWLTERNRRVKTGVE
jgi:hypothetical protein